MTNNEFITKHQLSSNEKGMLQEHSCAALFQEALDRLEKADKAREGVYHLWKQVLEELTVVNTKNRKLETQVVHLESENLRLEKAEARIKELEEECLSWKSEYGIHRYKRNQRRARA